MNVAHAMDYSQTVSRLSCYISNLSFFQPVMLFQLIKDMPLRCEFSNYVHILFVCEKAVKCDNV